MPNTSRLQWPYPAENQDPWYDQFESLVAAQDASAYASREDRHLILAKGGVFTWNASANTLTWSSTLEIISPLTGYRIDVAASSVQILDGQALFTTLVRGLTANGTATAEAASCVPNTDDAYAFGFRRGTDVYFRTGQKIRDGESRSIFASSFGGSGTKFISLVWAAGRESHNSDTPLIVGAFAFDPTQHVMAGCNMTVKFRAIAANGKTGLTNHVRLVNLTDSETVATLDFTSTNTAKDDVSLTVGDGIGQVKNSEKIYEVGIYLGAAPTDPLENIELYSAEIRVENTIA